MWAGFKVGHHCFQFFLATCCRSGLILTQPHSWEGSSQGKKQPRLEGVSIGRCPNPRWSPYLPSIIGIALGSRHLVPLCYYSVHSRSLTHHPRLYLSWSSALILQGNIARTKWYMGGVYDLSIPHDGILSNLTSNFGRSQHPLHPHL